MSALTQGTELFVLVPDPKNPTKKVVMAIKSLTNFNPGGSPSDQIEDTSLESTVKTFVQGLESPETATASINADPRIESHVRLYKLTQTNKGENFKWVVGWSDGKSTPGVNTKGDDFELSTDRTWFTFEGYIANFPFTFETNSIVKTEISIQRSGGSDWLEKGRAPDISVEEE